MCLIVLSPSAWLEMIPESMRLLINDVTGILGRACLEVGAGTEIASEPFKIWTLKKINFYIKVKNCLWL